MKVSTLMQVCFIPFACAYGIFAPKPSELEGMEITTAVKGRLEMSSTTLVTHRSTAAPLSKQDNVTTRIVAKRQGHFAPRPSELENFSTVLPKQADGKPAPHPLDIPALSTRNNNSTNDTGIQNLTFYSLNFYTPKQAPIYRFESTLIVPDFPNGTWTSQTVRAIWPGLQGDTLLQNVLNSHPSNGTSVEKSIGEGWYYLPFFCCDPAGNLDSETPVYPGDALTTTYVWDILHNKWLDSWVLAVANIGFDSGARGSTGGLTFDPIIAPGKGSPYDQAILAIELQGMGSWDFGSVTWKNIIVVAETEETEWCTKFTSTNNFRWHSTMPVTYTENNKTTCYIATVVFDQLDS